MSDPNVDPRIHHWQDMYWYHASQAWTQLGIDPEDMVHGNFVGMVEQGRKEQKSKQAEQETDHCASGDQQLFSVRSTNDRSKVNNEAGASSSPSTEQISITPSLRNNVHPMSTIDITVPAPQMPKRHKRACHQCRLLKARCNGDGNNACRSCRNNGWRCIYTDRPNDVRARQYAETWKEPDSCEIRLKRINVHINMAPRDRSTKGKVSSKVDGKSDSTEPQGSRGTKRPSPAGQESLKRTRSQASTSKPTRSTKKQKQNHAQQADDNLDPNDISSILASSISTPDKLQRLQELLHHAHPPTHPTITTAQLATLFNEIGQMYTPSFRSTETWYPPIDLHHCGSTRLITTHRSLTTTASPLTSLCPAQQQFIQQVLTILSKLTLVITYRVSRCFFHNPGEPVLCRNVDMPPAHICRLFTNVIVHVEVPFEDDKDSDMEDVIMTDAPSSCSMPRRRKEFSFLEPIGSLNRLGFQGTLSSLTLEFAIGPEFGLEPQHLLGIQKRDFQNEVESFLKEARVEFLRFEVRDLPDSWHGVRDKWVAAAMERPVSKLGVDHGYERWRKRRAME